MKLLVLHDVLLHKVAGSETWVAYLTPPTHIVGVASGLGATDAESQQLAEDALADAVSNANIRNQNEPSATFEEEIN